MVAIITVHAPLTKNKSSCSVASARQAKSTWIQLRCLTSALMQRDGRCSKSNWNQIRLTTSWAGARALDLANTTTRLFWFLEATLKEYSMTSHSLLTWRSRRSKKDPLCRLRPSRSRCRRCVTLLTKSRTLSIGANTRCWSWKRTSGPRSLHSRDIEMMGSYKA